MFSNDLSQGIDRWRPWTPQIDYKSILYKIKCPCLILTGSDDIVVSKEKSSFLIDQITHSMHHEIDGVGHAPYCENYTEFNDVINSFLTS